MATIRKRAWTTAGGEAREAWLVDFRDQSGRRRYKQFDRKKDADDWLLEARGRVKAGTFTPDSKSITVAQAAELWLRKCEAEGLEHSTMAQYRSHARNHIVPLIGKLKLSRLTMPRVEAWVDEMLAHGRSRLLAKAVLGSLRSITREARRLGKVAQDVTEGVKVKMPKRHERPVEPPTKAEVKALLEGVAPGSRERALLTLAALSGLRASEMRGLAWEHVDFRAKVIRVRQRADTSGRIGSPKSASSRRDVPMPPTLIAALKEWRLASGGRDPGGLVFPGRGANPICHNTVRSMGGRLHRLRHFYASWLIDEHFGPKRIQALMGHSSINITFDIYGHLFKDAGDHDKFAAADRALLG